MKIINLKLPRDIICPANRRLTIARLAAAKHQFILSSEYRDKMAMAQHEIRKQVIYDAPIDGLVSVLIESKRKSRDIDSEVKFLLDAMQGLVYTNDKQVAELTVRFSDGKKFEGNQVYVTATEIAQPAETVEGCPGCGKTGKKIQMGGNKFCSKKCLVNYGEDEE